MAELVFERSDSVIQFSDAAKPVGTVKIATRRRWWLPWTKRSVVIFEGDMDASVKVLFQTWGRLSDL